MKYLYSEQQDHSGKWNAHYVGVGGFNFLAHQVFLKLAKEACDLLLPEPLMSSVVVMKDGLI